MCCPRHSDLGSERYISFAPSSTTFISVRSLCLGSTPDRHGLVGWRAPVLRCGAAWWTEPSHRVADRVPALSLFVLSLHNIYQQRKCGKVVQNLCLDQTSGRRGSIGKSIAVWCWPFDNNRTAGTHLLCKLYTRNGLFNPKLHTVRYCSRVTFHWI